MPPASEGPIASEREAPPDDPQATNETGQPPATHPHEHASHKSPVIQWLGVIVVVSGLALAGANSFGVLYFADSTLRLFFGAGIILVGGREVILAIVDRAS